MRDFIAWVLALCVVGGLYVLVCGVCGSLLWNCVMPTLGLPPIGVGQAACLNVLISMAGVSWRFMAKQSVSDRVRWERGHDNVSSFH